MTITQSHISPGTVNQCATGSYTDDAATPGAMNIVVGFDPRYIRVLNLTTRVEYEWYKGMAATYTLKTAANGDRTADTGSAIVVTTAVLQKASGDDFDTIAGAAYQSTMPGATVATAQFAFIAAGIAQNDKLYWEVKGA